MRICINPAHLTTFLLSRKLFAEETNYPDTSCSVWSQVSYDSVSSLSLPKCLLNSYILSRADYQERTWCDSLAHMVWLSSPTQDPLVIHKHQLVTSSLWQSWAPNISGLISASGPEPGSCPAEISAEATWEPWDGVWRDEEHSTPWMKAMAQGWRQLAEDCMCLLCPVSSVLTILSDYKGPTKGCSWALQ